MNRTFQQRAQLRKITYAALILGLFTVSYVFRKYVVEDQAYVLQLREATRGEVNLASSAVRLLLTGSRGVAATVLWNQALDLRERHKWNELKLVVNSITQLQPYFVSPWLFQSWNIAFNVAVECEKPRDKYYYITTGMDVLAEGERRHRGADEIGTVRRRIQFPGNPEMRFYMGFYYLRKIGFSDENNTMRSLLEMSCIDPAERDAGRLWKADKYGGSVDRQRFERLCTNHPRLVRRLREQLGYDTPEEVVKFLETNANIPMRFQDMAATVAGEDRQTPLKEDWRQQWPAVPPPRGVPLWPHALQRELSTAEAVDVFFVSRAWFDYAQEPLPPPNGTPMLDEGFDRIRHRVPKMMMTVIFRSYPARSQAYLAENLETEGWFDEDGWLITGWFDDEPRVGTDNRFHAVPAWKLAYERYDDFGKKNGLYDSWRKGQDNSYRLNVNYDHYIAQCKAEQLPAAVYARKLFYAAERKRLEGATPEALSLLDQAMPYWLDVLLHLPDFRGDSTNIEQTYEYQRKYNSLFRDEQGWLVRKIGMGLGQMTFWPNPPFEELLPDSLKTRRLPLAAFRTPFEITYVLGLPVRQEEDVKLLTTAWLQGARGAMGLLPIPGQQSLMFTYSSLEPPRSAAWKPLITDATIDIVHSRWGIERKK